VDTCSSATQGRSAKGKNRPQSSGLVREAISHTSHRLQETIVSSPLQRLS
jgi:hypothetical protein